MTAPRATTPSTFCFSKSTLAAKGISKAPGTLIRKRFLPLIPAASRTCRAPLSRSEVTSLLNRAVMTAIFMGWVRPQKDDLSVLFLFGGSPRFLDGMELLEELFLQ